jgi:hypothetical protein
MMGNFFLQGTLVEFPLEIGGKGGLPFEALARVGVAEFEGKRMEEGAIRPRAVLGRNSGRVSIETVPEDRVPEGGQLDSDLVGAPREGSDFQEGGISKLGQNRKLEFGPTALFLYGHTVGLTTGAADHGLNVACFCSKRALDQGPVYFLNGTGRELVA